MLNGEYIKMSVNAASMITGHVSTVIEMQYSRFYSYPKYCLPIFSEIANGMVTATFWK